MPAAVKTYFDTHSFLESQHIQNIILDAYRNDFGKYASKTQHANLKKVFERAPALVGQRFKYAKVDPDIRSRELKVAIEQLVWAGIIQQIHATSASGVPLSAQVSEKKWKLLFLDVGLLQAFHEINATEYWVDDISQINSGCLAEQFVGQELLAYMNSRRENTIHFWQREKKSSSAEVDYVISHGEYIVPIEVKAGKTGRLKSMRIFMREKKSPFGVRISSAPLQFENNILSIPFYLIEHLPRFIEEVLRQHL